MKTVLLKTQVPQKKMKKAFIRYRLYAIEENKLEHLCSEESLPKIKEELLRLDNPVVILELNQLKEKEQELIANSSKSIKELSVDEKNRFYKYQKRKKEKLKVP